MFPGTQTYIFLMILLASNLIVWPSDVLAQRRSGGQQKQALIDLAKRVKQLELIAPPKSMYRGQTIDYHPWNSTIGKFIKNGLRQNGEYFIASENAIRFYDAGHQLVSEKVFFTAPTDGKILTSPDGSYILSGDRKVGIFTLQDADGKTYWTREIPRIMLSKRAQGNQPFLTRNGELIDPMVYCATQIDGSFCRTAINIYDIRGNKQEWRVLDPYDYRGGHFVVSTEGAYLAVDCAFNKMRRIGKKYYDKKKIGSLVALYDLRNRSEIWVKKFNMRHSKQLYVTPNAEYVVACKGDFATPDSDHDSYMEACYIIGHDGQLIRQLSWEDLSELRLQSISRSGNSVILEAHSNDKTRTQLMHVSVPLGEVSWKHEFAGYRLFWSGSMTDDGSRTAIMVSNASGSGATLTLIEKNGSIVTSLINENLKYCQLSNDGSWLWLIDRQGQVAFYRVVE